MPILPRLVLALALVLGSSAQAPSASAPVVRVDGGLIRGAGGWKTAAYFGVPFAAPPVGALRWMPPAKVAAWSGLRDATNLAKPCASEGLGDGVRTTNEDCLYLNVFAPAPVKAGAARPVMVFIHGGGNVSGSTTIYDGSRMAEVTGAVVVMPAYRLGVFGALAAPEAGTAGGTFILQDNLAALRWVRHNIAAFGGNAHDVTVSGESSGGTNVCNLLASPAAKGLFRQAIVQSGICQMDPTLAESQKQSVAFAATVGCAGTALLACLRAKDAGALIDAWKPAVTGTAAGGPLLPVPARDAFASGSFNRMPVLIGFNRDEWWPFEHGLVPLSVDGLQKKFEEAFPGRGPAVAARYPEAHFPHREYALGGATGDWLIICPSVKFADELSAHAPVSMYEFADRSAPPFRSLNTDAPQTRPAGYNGGASHTAELQYLYTYESAEGPLDQKQRRLADAMIQRWVAFNRSVPAEWPAYTASKPVVQQIGADGAHFVPIGGVAADHQCGFWNAKT